MFTCLKGESGFRTKTTPHNIDLRITALEISNKGQNRAGSASFGLLNLLIPNLSQNANYRKYAANIGIFAGFLATVKTWN